MFFSKSKIDLSASKSRAVIDAVRCVEIFNGKPTEIISIKTRRPAVYEGAFGGRARLAVEVLAKSGHYLLELRLDHNEIGCWSLEHGWMTFNKVRYVVRGHFGGYPSRSPELIADAVSIAVIGVEGKKNHAIYGTSWIHRITWPDTSGAAIDDALSELFRAKS